MEFSPNGEPGPEHRMWFRCECACASGASVRVRVRAYMWTRKCSASREMGVNRVRSSRGPDLTLVHGGTLPTSRATRVHSAEESGALLATGADDMGTYSLRRATLNRALQVCQT